MSHPTSEPGGEASGESPGEPSRASGETSGASGEASGEPSGASGEASPDVASRDEASRDEASGDEASGDEASRDAERSRDPMAPPEIPCECSCLHCGRVFMSDRMWFQKVIHARDRFDGFWRCPTPNCDGAGFSFDIFPTDPDHPANDGWFDDDEEVDDDFDDNPFTFGDEPGAESADDEWDPGEPKYADPGAEFTDDEDDLEGEEWKFGLQPGERPPESERAADAQRAWEEEQKRYDEPDERPRVIDWSDRHDRAADGESFGEDDIPF